MSVQSVRNPFDLHTARILLLIDAFSRPSSGLTGWDTLARADFLLRWPTVLEHVIVHRGDEMPLSEMATASERAAADGAPLRFQFGPWDTRYYPVVARLVGWALIDRRHTSTAPEFRSTPRGEMVARELAASAWARDSARARLIASRVRISAVAMTRLIERAIDELSTPHIPIAT